MGIFDSLRIYAGKWSVKGSRRFTDDEISAVSSAKVVDSQYGSSVCFFMKAGGQTYLPLSTESSLQVGDEVNLSEHRLITLEKSGEADILRVD